MATALAERKIDLDADIRKYEEKLKKTGKLEVLEHMILKDSKERVKETEKALEELPKVIQEVEPSSYELLMKKLKGMGL